MNYIPVINTKMNNLSISLLVFIFEIAPNINCVKCHRRESFQTVNINGINTILTIITTMHKDILQRSSHYSDLASGFDSFKYA